MSKFLRGRHEQIKKDVHDSADLLKQAKLKSAEQEHRLASLEKEIATLRESFQKDAEHEQARLITNAQEKAKRIQEDARLQLEQQVKSAEMRLRTEVAAASVKLAEELLKRTVGPEDDRRLAREFVSAFESSPMPGRRVP
jgi:F-type H+-transporting ATPase subunit b